MTAGSARRVLSSLSGWLSSAPMCVLVASVCLLPAVRLSAQGPRPTGVVVVPIGDVPIGVVQRVSQRYARHWSIPIDVRAAVALDPGLSDPKRGQVVAERVLLWLDTRIARQAPGRVVVGVVGADLYTAERSWRFAFSTRQRRAGAPGLAVMSTARMREDFYGEPANEALLADRFGKMLAKNLGVLVFGVALNDDPNSVMYKNILGLDDLDRITLGFDGRRLPR